MRITSIGSITRCLLLVLAGSIAACGQPSTEEATDADQATLLPDDGMLRQEYDGTIFLRIAEHFASTGADLTVTDSALTTFAPEWPLNDSRTAVLNRLGTPITYSNIVYFNSGFNVMRSSLIGTTDEVRAPHAGKAVVFDWLGAPTTPTSIVMPYYTYVGIYDSQTHLITVLGHIAPSAALLSAGSMNVTAGAPLGRLARAPITPAVDATHLASVEVVFVDGGAKKLLDPARFFASYKDSVPPEAASIYLTNDDREIGDQFQNGKFDVIVEAFDRDDASNRNLEVSAIGFSIKDQDGRALLEVPKCEIARDVFGDISARQQPQNGASNLHDLIDFNSAIPSQQSGAWPMSDVDNANRSFRYALSHLTVDANGKCGVRSDVDGFLDVPNAATKLDVTVNLWDAKGNTSEKIFQVDRIPNSQEFTVGGTVSGLVGEVTLRTNAKDLVVSANGAFEFPTPIRQTTNYRVTVKTQPPNQRCTVENPSGTISTGNVTDVAVSCVNVRAVGGKVTGLGTKPVVLQNNAGDNLTLSADGDFKFAKTVDEGAAYAVTILTQPSDRTCTVQNGAGTAAAVDIDDVRVTCN